MKKEEKRKDLPTSGITWGGGILESNPGIDWKRKLLLIVVGILLSIGIIIGASYAWWSYTTVQQSVNKINSDCLKIELIDESAAIELEKAYPLSDVEAKRLIPYQFTIKNTCNTSIVYDVSLEILESENRLASEYIAVEFDGGEKQILNTLSETEVTLENAVEGRYLIHGELGSFGSKSYSLKLWIDEHVTVEDNAMNKNFIGKIVVNASLNQIVYDYFNDYIIEQMEENNSIEKFEHPETNQTEALTDYRYVGANPNNYVYFGCEENCTEDNLYRIIGAIPTQSEIGGEYENRVKLIKANFYIENESGFYHSDGAAGYTGHSGGGYNWDGLHNQTNWEQSSLSIQVLNKVYWNSLEKYQEYIASSVWYTAAPSIGIRYSATPNQFYLDERSNQKSYYNGALSSINNIGLMYPSDYAFSAGSNFRNSVIYNTLSGIKSNAWLYNVENKYYEWVLNASGGMEGKYAWGIYASGNLEVGGALLINNAYGHWDIRPTFYLKSNVFYKSGNGTEENPYRIGI